MQRAFGSKSKPGGDGKEGPGAGVCKELFGQGQSVDKIELGLASMGNALDFFGQEFEIEGDIVADDHAVVQSIENFAVDLLEGESRFAGVIDKSLKAVCISADEGDLGDPVAKGGGAPRGFYIKCDDGDVAKPERRPGLLRDTAAPERNRL